MSHDNLLVSVPDVNNPSYHPFLWKFTTIGSNIYIVGVTIDNDEINVEKVPEKPFQKENKNTEN